MREQSEINIKQIESNDSRSSLSQGIVEIDLDGIIQFSNYYFNSIVGYSNGELINRNFLELISSDFDRSVMMNNIKLLTQNRHIQLQHLQFNKKRNDENIHLHFYVEGKYDLNNYLTGFYLITTENNLLSGHEHRKVNRLLKYYLHVVNQIEFGLIIVDNKNHVVFVNRRSLNILGVVKRELIGKSIAPFISQKTEKMLKKMDSTDNSTGVSSFISYLKNINKQKIRAVVNVVFLSDRERERHLKIMIIKEVDEINTLSKGNLDHNANNGNLIQKLGGLVVEVSIDGKFTFVSPSYLELFGYKESEIINRNVRSFMTDDEYKNANEIMEECIKSQQNKGILFKQQTVYGERCISWRFKPLFDNKNNIKSFLAEGRDITERIEHEVKIKEFSKQLEELNFVKDKIFQIISHDFRNPLGNIHNASELIKSLNENDNDDFKKLLEVINKSSKEINGFIEKIMLWSDINSQRILFTPIKTNIREIVDYVITSVNSAASVKKIMIKNQVDQKGVCFFDTKYLQIILRNILENAVKYSFPNSEVFITSVHENGKCIICIEDFGIGIQKEILEIIFDLKFNSKSCGTIGERGIGLGLIICQQLLLLGNSQVDIQSQPGKGTKVEIILPLNK